VNGIDGLEGAHHDFEVVDLPGAVPVDEVNAIDEDAIEFQLKLQHGLALAMQFAHIPKARMPEDEHRRAQVGQHHGLAGHGAVHHGRMKNDLIGQQRGQGAGVAVFHQRVPVLEWAWGHEGPRLRGKVCADYLSPAAQAATLQAMPDHLSTRLVHASGHDPHHGGVHPAIHPSVQYSHARVEDLIGVFQGTHKGAYNYARQGTPTTAALEAFITELEGGVGTVAFSTGMAALSGIFFTLLKSGDHLVTGNQVFGNTSSLFGTLESFGVAVSRVDTGSLAAVEAALRPDTRLVFVETLANPTTRIPDLAGIGALCKARGILFVVDNTVTSPALFQPRSVGAGLVMNSLTKTIAGHGAALGGAVTDTGCFDWSSYPNIFPNYRQGDPRTWGLAQVRKKGLRDMGGTLSSEAAHRILVGAETLQLRLDRCSATALALAQFLEAHPAVARVLYPMLPSHPQHAWAKEWFGSGSWMLSFELKDESRMLERLNRLRLPLKATGLADTRSLIIPVAPTIFWEMGAAGRAAMGIAEGLVRLSVGLEDASDLIDDFAQALG